MLLWGKWSQSGSLSRSRGPGARPCVCECASEPACTESRPVPYPVAACVGTQPAVCARSANGSQDFPWRDWRLVVRVDPQPWNKGRSDFPRALNFLPSAPVPCKPARPRMAAGQLAQLAGFVTVWYGGAIETPKAGTRGVTCHRYVLFGGRAPWSSGSPQGLAGCQWRARQGREGSASGGGDPGEASARVAPGACGLCVLQFRELWWRLCFAMQRSFESSEREPKPWRLGSPPWRRTSGALNHSGPLPNGSG